MTFLHSTRSCRTGKRQSVYFETIRFTHTDYLGTMDVRRPYRTLSQINHIVTEKIRYSTWSWIREIRNELQGNGLSIPDSNVIRAPSNDFLAFSGELQDGKTSAYLLRNDQVHPHWSFNHFGCTHALQDDIADKSNHYGKRFYIPPETEFVISEMMYKPFDEIWWKKICQRNALS